MEQAKKKYEKFQAQKNVLENLLGKGKLIFSGLGMVDSEKELIEKERQLASDVFKVIVMGRFNAGKSTFINAILPGKILPAKALPTTAVITVLKYHNNNKVLLHFKKDQPASIPASTPQDVLLHLQKYKTQPVPPLEVPIQDLNKYIVIKNVAGAEASGEESPYELVEIFGPFGICEDGVELIDSPGLDEKKGRAKITIDYSKKMDAVIFLISAHSIGSEMDMLFIRENIKKLGHEYILFIHTHIDQIMEEDKEELLKTGIQLLAPYTRFGERGIFFVDALSALEGKCTHNTGQVTDSGIEPAETLLADFLTREKGKVKIKILAESFGNEISRALGELIPKQQKKIDEDQSGEQDRYRSSAAALEKLKFLRQQIIEAMEIRLENAGIDIRKTVEANFKEIAKNTDSWINGIQVSNEFELSNPKSSAMEIATEIINKYKLRLQRHQEEWGPGILAPLIKKKKKNIYESQGGLLDEFFKVRKSLLLLVKNIQKDDAAIDSSADEWAPLNDPDDVIGSGGLDNDFLTDEIIRSVIVSITTTVAVLIMGFLNPITIILAIGIVLLISLSGAKERINQKIKDKIATTIKSTLVQNEAVSIEETVEEIMSGLRKPVEKISENLENEIQSLSNHADTCFANIEATKKEAQQKKERLLQFESELRKIEDELTDLKTSLE